MIQIFCTETKRGVTGVNDTLPELASTELSYEQKAFFDTGFISLFPFLSDDFFKGKSFVN